MESDGSCNLPMWRTQIERIPKGIYTPEFRVEAVKLVETTGISVAIAAKQLSMPKSSLDNWVRAAREGELAQVGKGQRLPLELELELARTRKELAEVKVERDLPKKVCDVFRKGVAVKYRRIRELRQVYPVAAMCRMLGSSESGYYA